MVLHGPRQAGKSTLARLIADRLGGDYVTFDRAAELEAALADPKPYLDALRRPTVVDEIQRGGDRVVLAVKETVDLDDRRGLFMLTGSTNFLTVPTISESLAGRADIVTLLPLSQAEIDRTRGDWVTRAFAASDKLGFHAGETPSREEYVERVCRGGYPEVQKLERRHRARWFAQYSETVIQREIESAADIRRAGLLRTTLELLAAQTSQAVVVSDLAGRLGADRVTIDAYVGWLESAFLVTRVPSWSRNASRRVLRRPKLHLVDSGLAAALIGKDEAALSSPKDPSFGGLLETFVVGELSKQLAWQGQDLRLFYYRESGGGAEVDAIVERRDGRLLAIEVKATTSPRPQDASGLRALRRRLDAVGDDFVVGVLFHTGNRRIAFDDRIVALPIADLWT
ncbi:MAG: ATP-binding protein [Gaiellales bacterium]